MILKTSVGRGLTLKNADKTSIYFCLPIHQNNKFCGFDKSLIIMQISENLRPKCMDNISRDICCQKEIKKPHPFLDEAFNLNPGGVLLSHTVSHAVPSALEGLTSVFGMGTGVAPPV